MAGWICAENQRTASERTAGSISRAVAGDEGVGELVDEAHGEEGAGVVRACGVGVRAARFVQRFGELAARGDVGEDDVAGVAEEQVVDLGCFADGAGDVKFHS